MSDKPNWRDTAKDIPKGEGLPDTKEGWETRAQMDLELIMEQREEINKLKIKDNQQVQKITHLQACLEKSSFVLSKGETVEVVNNTGVLDLIRESKKDG